MMRAIHHAERSAVTEEQWLTSTDPTHMLEPPVPPKHPFEGCAQASKGTIPYGH